MKLNPKEYKRFQELSRKKDLTEEEKAELATLLTKKRNSDDKEKSYKNKGSRNACNDFTWHNKYPNLMKGAAVVSNNYVPGTTYRFAGNYHKMFAGLKVYMLLTPGRCENPTDAFNLQSKSIWTILHRKYRGVGGYESSDYGIAQFAIAQAYALVFQAERIYGVANYYDVRNRNIPDIYQDLLTIDLNDVRTHLADYRYRLNTIIKKMKLLAVLKGISAFEDYDRLFSNVFVDRASARSQLVVFTTGLEAWKWDPTVFGSGSALTLDELIPSGAYPTGEEYLNWISTLVDALVTDDDIQKMISDTLAAFNDAELMTISLLEEGYECHPAYSEERVLQIHNMTCLDLDSSWSYKSKTPDYTKSQFAIYQDNNVIKFTPYLVKDSGSMVVGTNARSEQFIYNASAFNAPGAIRMGQFASMMDIWKDEATVEEVVEATRMQYVFESEYQVDVNTSPSTPLNLVNLKGFGAYICRRAVLFVRESQYNTLSTQNIATVTCSAYLGTQAWATGYTSSTAAIGALSQFEQAPILNFNYYVYAGSIQEQHTLIGAIDNVFTIPADALIRVSDTSILSLWKYPESIIVE